MIARAITYFGQTAVVACDAQCGKAWGINNRPLVQLGEDPDDFAYLADHELGEAPVDPGTYEGGDAKPSTPAARLNRWCVRECERSVKSPAGKPNAMIETPDFSRRLFNQPWLHKDDAAAGGEPAEVAL